MKQIKIFLLVAGVAIMSLTLWPAKARAQASPNDFIVTNFSGDYYLSKNDPQGALDITEHLTVDFPGQNHGILRALPQNYNGQPLHLNIKSVAMGSHSEHYITYTQNGNLMLKIGDPNQTVTGTQSYQIDYRVKNVMRFINNHEEFDWNINGDQWPEAFEHVSATLHLPTDIATKASNAQCYTGAYRSSISDCTLSMIQDHSKVTFTANQTLQPYTSLTIRVDFEKGIFVAPTFKDWLHDHWLQITGALIPPLLTLLFVGGWWWLAGKDHKGRGTIIPEYDPPDNLKPAEVDVITHFKLSTKAISATIIDLAIRKYIKIIEIDKKQTLGLGKSKDYQLQLLKVNLKQLSDYERQIVGAIFGTGAEINSVVNVSNLTGFYTTSQALQKLLPIQLTTAGYFPKNPTKMGHSLHIIGIVIIFASISLHTIGLVLAGLICVLFGFLMPKRSAKGVAANDAIKGLKMYMEVAEKDRIQMLQSPVAPYAEKSGEPVKTVELYEKLLPYAMVLGVEQQWAKQFASIYLQPPSWYAGNWTTFNVIYFASSLNNSVGAMTSYFAPPHSSGSGMGGGFASGGGGGGGGGGW